MRPRKPQDTPPPPLLAADPATRGRRGNRGRCIDLNASPDLRAQLLDAGIGRLDAGWFFTLCPCRYTPTGSTTCPAMIVFNIAPAPAGLGPTGRAQVGNDAAVALSAMPSCSRRPRPIRRFLDLNAIDGERHHFDGPGGLEFIPEPSPSRWSHGNIDALGLSHTGDIAYLPDVLGHSRGDLARARPNLEMLGSWTRLRRTPHPSHRASGAVPWAGSSVPRHATRC